MYKTGIILLTLLAVFLFVKLNKTSSELNEANSYVAQLQREIEQAQERISDLEHSIELANDRIRDANDAINSAKYSAWSTMTIWEMQ